MNLSFHTAALPHLRQGRFFRDRAFRGRFAVLALLIWYVAAAVAVGFFGAPGILNNLGDLILVWLTVEALAGRQAKRLLTDCVLWAMALFCAIGLVSALICRVSLPLIAWGLRQNCRFFLYYYGCLTFLKKEDLQWIFRFVAVLFWLSLPLSVGEVMLGHFPENAVIGDYIGGVYYGAEGVNTPLNAVLVVYCAKKLNDFFTGRTGLAVLLHVLTAALVTAVMAEMKFFFIELMVIAAFYIFTNRPGWRSLALVSLGCIGILLAIRLYARVNPTQYRDFAENSISIEYLLVKVNRSTGYTGIGDFNRGNAIKRINEEFFAGDKRSQLLGIGLGGGEFSDRFELFNSPFYEQNWLTHYQYFLHALLYLQTGLVGLVAYCGIFFTAAAQALVRVPKGDGYKRLSILLPLLMLITVFYNTGMREEQTAFLLFGLLSAPMLQNQI